MPVEPHGIALAVCVVLGGCATRPPAADPAPPPPVERPAAPPVASTAPTDEPPVDDRVPPDAGAASGAAAIDVARRFVDAVNAGEMSEVQALSSPDCWQDECESFATQALTKFKARLDGAAEVSGERAVAHVTVVCPGERECDKVHLLLEARGGVWRVADLKESDAAAHAWLGPNAPEGNPSPAPVAPSGGGFMASLARGVAAMRPDLRRCYNTALKKDPNSHGGVRLTLVIDAAGNVTSAKAETTGRVSQQALSCIEARARAAHFDPPDTAPATVAIPINFTGP